MALTDRAAALAPYAQQLLYNQEVQDAIGRASGATREAYRRARGKRASEALQDKKRRRRLQIAAAAAGEVWSAIGEPAPRPKARWRGRLAALALVGGGVFVAANAGARRRILDLFGFGTNDA